MTDLRDSFINSLIEQSDWLQSNRKLLISFCIAASIVTGSVVSWWFYEDKNAENNNINAAFSGVVQTVYYDAKGCPKLTINYVDYYIGVGYHVHGQIDIGDSIVKQRGSTIYKLIKKQSKDVIWFDR